MPNVRSIEMIGISRSVDSYLGDVDSSRLPILFIIMPSTRRANASPSGIRRSGLYLVFLVSHVSVRHHNPIQILRSARPLIRDVGGIVHNSEGEKYYLVHGLSQVAAAPRAKFCASCDN